MFESLIESKRRFLQVMTLATARCDEIHPSVYTGASISVQYMAPRRHCMYSATLHDTLSLTFTNIIHTRRRQVAMILSSAH